MPKKLTAPEPKFTPSHPSAPWRVYHQGRSFWFKNEKDAQAKCDEVAKGQGNKLTTRELDEYRHAKELLAGTPLLHAVRYFIERHPQVNRTLTVNSAIDAHLLGYKKSRPDYYDRKVYLLDKLRDRCGESLLATVSPHTIDQLLKAESSDWVRNDLLTHLRVFFRQAAKTKLVPEDPTAAYTFIETKPSKVILTLADTRHVLETAEAQFPDILPAVALQLFSGIRTAEITRLDWAHVKHGEFINIEPEVAKTHERRVIDWWPKALTTWMPKVPESGAILPFPKTYEHKKWMLLAVCKKTKTDFKFGQNAFRHSFCSYACAYFENAGKATLLAGQHDVDIFFRHYRAYRTKAEAEEYFSISKAV